MSGFHPLSRSSAGKQIKDLDEVSKLEYFDVYRPAGLVKIKQEVHPVKPLDQSHGASSSLSNA